MKKTLVILTVLVVLAGMLAACAQPEPETIIETVVVEKEVIVTQEVEVEKEVIVTQEVEVEKEVKVVETVEVEKEVVVEVTAVPEGPKKFDGRSINLLVAQPHAVAGRAAAEWFEEETGARVNVLVVPYSNITEKATLDVTSGAGEYDVIQYWYVMLGSLVENGVLRDISEWWDANADEFEADDFVPAFRDTYTLIDGQRYGIPYDGDIHLMFYNTTLFDKHGVEPPVTWDDYLEVCKTITEGEEGNEVYGCGIMGVKVPIILVGTYLNRLAGFGGDFMDADGNPTINSPEAIAALEHLLAEMPYAVPDPTAVGFDEMLGPWLTGRAGMAEFWTDLGQMTDNPEQSTIIGEWGVAPMPVQGEKGRVAAPMNAGWGMGLSTTPQDEEVALEFLSFISQPETNVRQNTIVGGLDPTRISTFDDPAFRAHVTDALADAAKEAVLSAAVPWPTHARWAEMMEILNENLAQAMIGEMTAEEALNDTQAAWEELVAE